MEERQGHGALSEFEVSYSWLFRFWWVISAGRTLLADELDNLHESRGIPISKTNEDDGWLVDAPPP